MLLHSLHSTKMQEEINNVSCISINQTCLSSLTQVALSDATWPLGFGVVPVLVVVIWLEHRVTCFLFVLRVHCWESPVTVNYDSFFGSLSRRELPPWEARYQNFVFFLLLTVFFLSCYEQDALSPPMKIDFLSPTSHSPHYPSSNPFANSD